MGVISSLCMYLLINLPTTFFLNVCPQHAQALSHACSMLVDASLVHCSMPHQTFSRHCQELVAVTLFDVGNKSVS